MAKGLDISIYQGNVDFHTLKDNADFVFIRATYGNGYLDRNFTKNRDGARKVGLGIGYYHYSYPQYNSPLAEADWFCKNVSCQPGELMALDFEEHYPDPVNWSKLFLDRCTSNMGFRPVLYINYALARTYNWQPVVNGNYGLWLAYWTYNPDTPLPKDLAWSTIAFRQWTNKGTLAGLNPVDLDVFYGDMNAFKKYGNPPPATTTSVSTGDTQPPTTVTTGDNPATTTTVTTEGPTVVTVPVDEPPATIPTTPPIATDTPPPSTNNNNNAPPVVKPILYTPISELIRRFFAWLFSR